MFGVTTQRSGYTVLNRHAVIFAITMTVLFSIVIFEFQPELSIARESVSKPTSGPVFHAQPEPEVFNDGRVAKREAIIDHDEADRRNDHSVLVSVKKEPYKLFDRDAPFWQRGPVRRIAAYGACRVTCAIGNLFRR